MFWIHTNDFSINVNGQFEGLWEMSHLGRMHDRERLDDSLFLSTRLPHTRFTLL